MSDLHTLAMESFRRVKAKNYPFTIKVPSPEPLPQHLRPEVAKDSLETDFIRIPFPELGHSVWMFPTIEGLDEFILYMEGTKDA